MNKEGIFIKALLITEIGLTIGGILFNRWVYVRIVPNPISLLTNLGMALSILGGIRFLEDAKFFKKITFLGEESLIMYVAI